MYSGHVALGLWEQSGFRVVPAYTVCLGAWFIIIKWQYSPKGQPMPVVLSRGRGKKHSCAAPGQLASGGKSVELLFPSSRQRDEVLLHSALLITVWAG